MKLAAYLFAAVSIGWLISVVSSHEPYEPPNDYYTSPEPTAQAKAPESEPEAKQEAEAPTNLDLIYYGRTVAKGGLKSPSSATFPLPESGAYGITDLGDNRYRVSGRVDARNAFNTEIREPWVVEFRLVGDRIITEYIEIGEQVVFGG